VVQLSYLTSSFQNISAGPRQHGHFGFRGPPSGPHDHIFVLSRLSRVLKWGLLFDERRGLTATGMLLLSPVGMTDR
jgi:hypothetical protein